MEFKSQICTTREQSKRLLALGLKPGTADMVYHYSLCNDTPYLHWNGSCKLSRQHQEGSFGLRKE